EERALEKLRREVEAFENFEEIRRTSREPIEESVRLFVWQRDGGRCVRCRSQDRLEYDHIIPLALGGSNRERNIQLLCETCNRAKGAKLAPDSAPLAPVDRIRVLVVDDEPRVRDLL